MTSTDFSITDETVDADDRTNDKDYGVLLPSASVRLRLSDSDRITASVARTVRRPNFDFLSPWEGMTNVMLAGDEKAEAPTGQDQPGSNK